MSSGTQCLFAFRSRLKKTTIIIDCFEVFIERPSNLARAQTFSNYKLHITHITKDPFVLLPKQGEEGPLDAKGPCYSRLKVRHSGKHCTLPGTISYPYLH